ncbi:MAG: GerW family sporulation protein [Thermaerobacter sp.]|nr:GerW family sporulation protein [Thermaerobacter sp.]
MGNRESVGHPDELTQNYGPGAGHPIEGLMKTAMESIKGMIDVNTVVGSPVSTEDGTTIIPISRVSFGFAAGGGEFWRPDRTTTGPTAARPFGGGSGAGVSVRPMGFLVQRGDAVRMLSVEGGDVWDRLLEAGPQIVEQVQNWLAGGKEPHESRYTYPSSPDAAP